MIRLGHSVFFGIACSIAGTALSAPVELRMRHIPPVANTLCDDYAYAEGQRLRTYFKDTATITDARCESDDIGNEVASWNINITFETPSPIPQITTRSNRSLYHPGFAKRQECENALKEEKERFTRATKIPAFAAYCYAPSFHDGQWSATVIGFGNTDVQAYAISFPLFGKVLNHSLTSFTAMIRQGMTKLGAEVGQISQEGRLAYSNISLNYYAKEYINIDNRRVSIFSTNDACLKEIPAAVEGLAQAGVSNAGVYCTAAYTNEIELTVLRDDRTKLTIAEASTLYDTPALCEAQKAKTVEHYRNDLKRDIKAAFCSLNRNIELSVVDRVRVVMIEKK